MPPTGPYNAIAALVTAKRRKTHTIEKLQQMRKEMLALADQAYALQCPLLGEQLRLAAHKATEAILLIDNP